MIAGHYIPDSTYPSGRWVATTCSSSSSEYIVIKEGVCSGAVFITYESAGKPEPKQEPAITSRIPFERSPRPTRDLRSALKPRLQQPQSSYG